MRKAATCANLRAPALSYFGVPDKNRGKGPVFATSLSLRGFLIVFLGLSFAVLGWRSVSAQTDIALTADMVGSFAASYADVKVKADELSAKYEVPDGGTASAAWQAWMGVGGAKEELDDTVGAYGFSDFAAWIQTFSAVARAYAFAKDSGALDSEMAAALEKIRTDPNIPQAQKDMLLQQLQASAGAISGMRPSQENIDAVAPHVDQLSAVFEGN
jgi:hypothetical protein